MCKSPYNLSVKNILMAFIVMLPVTAPANDNPVADAGPNQSVAPGTTVQLDGSNSTDSDGSIVKYRWLQTRGPVVSLSDRKAAITDFQMPADAQVAFRLKVFDDQNSRDTDSVLIESVPNNNQKPVAHAGPDQTVSIVATVSLNGTGSVDPDGTISKYVWSQLLGPNVSLMNKKTATASFVADTPGAYQFKLKVEDNGGAKKADKIWITVENNNQPPVANAGADAVHVENSTYFHPGYASDPDGTIVALQWQQLSGPAVTFLDSPSSELYLKLPSVAGDTDVVMRLTATDNSGATASDDMTITILEYIPPIASAGIDQVVALGDSITLTGSATDTQPGNSLEARYQWRQLSGTPATLRYGENHHHIEVTPNLVDETLLFELTVSDTSGSAVTDTVMLTVVSPGSGDSQPPIANAGPDGVSPAPRRLLLDASASVDPDGSIVDYHWETLSSPGPFDVVDANSPDPFYYDYSVGAGIYALRLTVTDNTGASASDEVTVTVLDSVPAGNLAPTVDAGAATNSPAYYFHMDDEEDLTGTASDPDGSIASTRWYQVAGPVARELLDRNALNARFVFAPYRGPANGQNFQHEHTFLLVATDDQGASAADHTSRTIAYINSSPYATPESARILMLEGTTHLLSGLYSYDPDNFIDHYLWQKTYGAAATISDSTAAEPTITLPLVSGRATLGYELTVTDRDGGTDTESISLYVVPRDQQAQYYEAGADKTVSPGDTVSLNAVPFFSNVPDDPHFWYQLTGPTVDIADTSAWDTSFVAPAVTESTEIVLAFAQIDFAFGHLIIVDADVLTITITPDNVAPIADAGLPQTLPELTETELNGSGSYDPDGTISQFQWQQTQGPLAFIEDSRSDITTIITPPVGVESILTFELTVTDELGDSSTATTTITVQPNLTDGDIDGDGIADENDVFPNDSTDAYDFDGDGIGDNADSDRDGDGVNNNNDWHPNDPNLSAAPTITITSPLAGATHPEGQVRVTGTVVAPPNTGITVNGVVAHRSDDLLGSEYASIVLLEDGSNEITVTATLLSGKQITQSIAVTTGSERLFTAYVTPDRAIEQERVSFQIYDLDEADTIDIQQIELDYDGDGVVEDIISSDFDQPITYDYTQPGLYLPQVTVIDTDNNSHRYDLSLDIESELKQNQLIPELWNGMNNALVAGNYELAVEMILEDNRKSYSSILYHLLPYMADIVSGYTGIERVNLGISYGEYAVGENIVGVNRIFFIQFIEDADGVWRVEGM